MGNDIDIIIKIEKQVGKNLKQLDFEQFFSLKNGYLINEHGNITGLNLSDLKISEISFLKELNRLTHLVLASNKISDISPLKELHALKRLYLQENQISDISPLKELRNLKKLNLANNHISQLPIELVQLGMEIIWETEGPGDDLYLKDNPWEVPPIEIVKQGTEAI